MRAFPLFIPQQRAPKQPMSKYYSDVFLTLALFAGLTFALLWPIGASGGLRGGDKVVHFLAFAILAFPIACIGRLRMSILFFACSIYGGVIELIEPSFGRGAEVLVYLFSTRKILCSNLCDQRAHATCPFYLQNFLEKQFGQTHSSEWTGS